MYTNTIWGDIKWQYRYGGPLIKIILINIAVFIVEGILGLVDFFAKTGLIDKFISFFSDYSSLHGLLRHPWGIITGMFLHDGFLHILYNMLFLYWFGTIIQDYLSKNRIAPIYFLGGIFSSLISIPAYYLFNLLQKGFIPDQGIGASAGVMAIVLAAATLVPDNEINFLIVGRVKIKWIALVYVILDIISIPSHNAGGHIAHLGGAFFGWFYIFKLRNGSDLAKPFFWVQDMFASLVNKKNKVKTAYKKTEKEYANVGRRRENKMQTNSSKQAKQERLDEILDKISKSGYESLDKEEKDFLFQISKED